MLVNVLAAALTVLGLVENVPQLTRALRTRRSDGLSPVALIGGSVGYLCWTVLLVIENNPAAVVATAIPGLVWLALCAAVFASGQRPNARQLAFGLLPLPTSILAGFAAAGPSGATLALSLSALFTYIPATITCWRSDNLTGISPTTSILLLAGTSGWAMLAVATHSTSLFILSATTLPLIALINLRIFTHKPAAKRNPPAEAGGFRHSRDANVTSSATLPCQDGANATADAS